MATIYDTNGLEKEIQKEYLSLETMQKIVGGWIECVPFPDGKTLVCNEEGKVHGLPVNERATAIWNSYFGDTDVIVGNVIIAEPGELQ